LFLDDPNLRIVADQFLEQWFRVTAIRTAVVEKFHDRHVAVRISQGRRLWVIEKILLVARDESFGRGVSFILSFQLRQP
jgi:hypothetical protein